MEKHDLSPIRGELKKALEGAENKLETEVNNLITRFADYQEEVVKLSNLSLATNHEIGKLNETVIHFAKAFELIEEILKGSQPAEEKISALKKLVSK